MSEAANPYKERRVAQLVAELNLLHGALEEIKRYYGKVCGSYETCTHESCQSSYAAWATADVALHAWDKLAYARALDDTHDTFLAELAAATTNAERAQILEDNK